jgi:hypothetical protein
MIRYAERKHTIRNEVIEFTRNNFPEMFAKLDYLNAPDVFKYGQITGEMMSGKSQMIGAYCLASVFVFEQTTFVFPNSSDQVVQMCESIDNLNTLWNNHMRERHDFVCPLEILCASDLKEDDNGRLVDVDMVRHDLAVDDDECAESKKVVVCLADTIQLSRLVKLHKMFFHDGVFLKYRAVFDESHSSMFHDVKRKHTVEYLTYTDDELTTTLNCSDSTHYLIENAEQTVGVSATPLNNLFGDNYQVSFIVQVLPRAGYRDLLSLTFVPTAEWKGDAHTNPEIRRYLSVLASRPALDRDNSPGLMLPHIPRVDMIQASSFKVDHFRIEECVRAAHPNDFSTIIFNSEEVVLRFPETVAEYIERNLGGKVEYSTGHRSKTARMVDGRIRIDVHTPINKCLDIFTQLGLTRFDRILIICGRRIAEAIRVNSSDYTLALSSEFFSPSKSGTWDKKAQMVRAVGYRKYNATIEIWATEKDHADVIKAYMANQELVKKLTERFQFYKLDPTGSYDILTETRVCRGKLPRGGLCKTRAPFSKVSGNTDDLEKSVDDYTKEIRRTAENVDDGAEDGVWSDEGEGKKISKIQKFKNGTVVGQVYTREQIMDIIENAGYEQPSSILSSFSKERNSSTSVKRYGEFLLRHVDGDSFERI